MVLRSVWYSFVCIPDSYYREFVCSWPALHICYQHHNAWVRFIHIKKVWLRVCHHYYCLCIYDESFISFCFLYTLINGLKVVNLLTNIESILRKYGFKVLWYHLVFICLNLKFISIYPESSHSNEQQHYFLCDNHCHVWV